VGTLIAFRMGREDSRILHEPLSPEVDCLDLVNLPDHDVYVRLLVQGQPARPCSVDDAAELQGRHAATLSGTDGYKPYTTRPGATGPCSSDWSPPTPRSFSL
jgi:hypothetical protein